VGTFLVGGSWLGIGCALLVVKLGTGRVWVDGSTGKLTHDLSLIYIMQD